MEASLLKDKIEDLQNLAESLLYIGDNSGYVYADDLFLLNQKINEAINILYPQRGKTVEQEAALCLVLLKAFSVSMYANPVDEIKRQKVLLRSRQNLSFLPPSVLKQQLLAIYNEYASL